VGPKTESRSGSATRSGSARSAAPAAASRSAGPGRPIRSRRPPPQLRLPGQVGRARVEVDLAAAPGLQQLGAVRGVGGEQLGQVPRDRVPAPAVALDVPAQRGAPRLVGALVDHLEQRPHRALRAPGVGVLVGPGGRADRGRDDGGRRRELDPGAHPVAALGAEPVREPVRQPALHALRRNRHDLGGERVGQRAREQLGERVGQRVGPLGPVHRQHRPHLPPTR
jgi:hypothetical protein